MKPTFENYLKHIFKIQHPQGDIVKPLALSKGLGVSQAAVSEMLKKLTDADFITYTPYQGISLTPKGQIEGQNMVRRHRLWELYLHQVLGFPWDKVHEEAELLEHASSDAVINKLEEALGFPEYDPHGDPIPSKEGVFPKAIASIPLSKCQAKDVVRIVRVSDFDNEFLHYINTLGIQLHTTLTIKSIRSFDRSFVVSIQGHQETISEFTTQHIFVTKEAP